MRRPAFRVALALSALAAGARAQEASPAPLANPPTSSTPPPAAAPTDDVHAELARQAAAIDELRASLDRERAQREHPAIRLSGFLQLDWILHNQQSQNDVNAAGQPLNQDRITLRRGHVRVDAEQGMLLGALEIDANTTNGPQVRPIEAAVSLRWPPEPNAGNGPSFLATVGLLRIPFGFEVQEADYVRPFLERANVLQALFPGEFDLGLRFKAKYRFLDWAIALMNGNPIGDKVFPALDPDRTKEIVGRVGVDFEIAPGIRFQAGASADTGTGFHAGTPATSAVLVWQDGNGDGLVEPNEIVAIGGSPATPSQEFHRFAVGGDARLSVRIAPLGDLSFRAEIVDGLNLDRGLEFADPIGAGHDLRELGWSGAATQEITKWAMVGARYDRYNPDADASQQRAVNLVPVDRSYSTLALMGMVRYRGGRLLLEYDINQNPLGVGANGAPTTLAADALTLRGQMVF